MPNRYSKAASSPGEFSKYFIENMEALGLDAPKGFFDTLDKAINTSLLLGDSINSLGSKATISEIKGATTFKEKAVLTMAGRGIYYLGAVVGSIAVAAGRIIGNGTEIADLYFVFHKNKYKFLNVPVFYNQHREIIDPSIRNRNYYAIKAKKYIR